MLKIKKFEDIDYTKALGRGEVQGKDYLGLYRVSDVIPTVCAEGCEYVLCTDAQEIDETKWYIEHLKDKIYYDERYKSLENLFKVNKLHYYNIDRLKKIENKKVCQVYEFEDITIYYVVHKHKLVFALNALASPFCRGEELWDNSAPIIGMLDVYSDTLMYDTRRKAICYRERAKVIYEFNFYQILEEINRRELEFINSNP